MTTLFSSLSHLLGILRPSDSEDEHACERAVVVALVVGFVT